jgi:hypothetical protein
MDIRDRVDEFLKADKSIFGSPTWTTSNRSEMRVMKRTLLQEGEGVDAFIVSQAFPGTTDREFRYLITFEGRCICRLDYARTIDGPHFNGMDCGAAYPVEKMDGLHYHDWPGNRHRATASTLPDRLGCARDVQIDGIDIDKAFWWFCHDNNIWATSGEVPGWPPRESLL